MATNKMETGPEHPQLYYSVDWRKIFNLFFWIYLLINVLLTDSSTTFPTSHKMNSCT